jgi:hypothetical protein
MHEQTGQSAALLAVVNVLIKKGLVTPEEVLQEIDRISKLALTRTSMSAEGHQALDFLRHMIEATHRVKTARQ